MARPAQQSPAERLIEVRGRRVYRRRPAGKRGRTVMAGEGRLPTIRDLP